MKNIKNLINKMLAYIGKSIFDKKDGKVSSTRIASYFILGGILTSIALFAGVELVNAIVMWSKGLAYVIPGEHIGIFGMILAHHLTLLGINKHAERKVDVANQERLKGLTHNPQDMSTTPPEYPVPSVSVEIPEEEGPSDSDMI